MFIGNSDKSVPSGRLGKFNKHDAAALAPVAVGVAFIVAMLLTIAICG